MESTSDRIKMFASNVLGKIANAKPYLVTFILIVIVVFIGYYLSYYNRTGQKIQEVLKTHKSNISFQTDYCHENYRRYNLVDFHIKSSYNPLATGFKKYDYISLNMLYQVLRLGTRYLEFQIFAKEQNNDSIPVISIGSKRGDWKMTANVLDCKEVFNLLAINGFSQKLLENYRDPLFIFLDIKTDNVTVLNKLAEILESAFKINLLDKTYQYQSKNIAETKVCDLLDKVVIMSSGGYINSDLEKLINVSTDSPSLERLNYSDLILQKKFNVNQPDFILTSNKISFHKGMTNDYIEIHDYKINLQEKNITRDMKIKIGNSRLPQNKTGEHLLTIDNITDKKISFKKHDKISFSREELGNTIIVQGYNINEASKNIEENNKIRLTIVIPDYDLFSANFNPKNIWYTGTQFVAMNFQTIDDNMSMYLKFFEKRAIKLKQSSLLNDRKRLKNTNFPTNKVVIDKDKKFNADCEEVEDNTYPSTSSTISNEDIGKRLSQYDTELNTQKVFNVHFDFLKNNLALDVFFQPKFNPDLRVIKDHLGNLRMSLDYQNNRSVFQITQSQNKKIPNSVQVIKGDSILVVNENQKLGFETPSKEVLNSTEFIEKSTFLILEPSCGKDKMCSLGYVTYEKLGENKRESTPILNYLKVKTNFSTNNRIYKYNQTKYRKILSLKSFTKTRQREVGSDFVEVVSEYSIWRPFKHNNFFPVGDVIFEGNSIPTINNSDNEFVASTIVTGSTKHPIGYEKVMKYDKSTNNDDTDSFVIWKPIPPDGYVSMGYVTVKNGGDTPPSKKAVVCVGANFVKTAELFGESSDNVSNRFSKYNRQYFNNKISFWKGKNINYYVPAPTKIIDFNRGLNNFNLEPPLEFDYPIFEFVDFSDFQEDLLFLDKNISKVSDREASCFKFTVTYKSGEFTEYDLYNGLDEMPDRDGKIISFIRNRNNGNLCVSLPNSYWSNHYKEITSYEPEDTDNENNDTGTYNYLSKFDKCPEGSRVIGATVHATEEDCFKIGGYMNNTNKFIASISPDKTAHCYLDICDSKSKDTIYMNKSRACGEGSKLGDAYIQTTFEDCMNMGGDYDGVVEDANKIVKCKIDMCKQPTKFSYKLPRGEQQAGDLGRATYRMDFIPTENDPNPKCTNLHNEAVVEGSICQIPIDYSRAAEGVELNVSSCRDRNYFGTSFDHMNDNTIRLRDNKEYCLTVPLDSIGNPITERKSEKSGSSASGDNKLSLNSCKSSRRGQQFAKDRNNNIKFISNTDGITNFCLTSEYDNSLRLNECNPIIARQKWSFENMPSDYCITVGSIVYYFKKIGRSSRGNSPNNILNLPVENLLQEEFDYNNFHLYVRGRVKQIERNVITVQDLSNNDLVRFNKESQMNEIILEYTPPVEKLELGTKVIAKNGSFLKIEPDGEGVISYTDENIKWYGVVTKKLKNGNYKVFFSINSIEPDQRNKKCGRPDYSMVKEISINDMYLLRNTTLC
jgi:hypothetical protein